MNDYICPQCGSPLRCLAGESAHPDNWYCTNINCEWRAWGNRPTRTMGTDMTTNTTDRRSGHDWLWPEIAAIAFAAFVCGAVVGMML